MEDVTIRKRSRTRRIWGATLPWRSTTAADARGPGVVDQSRTARTQRDADSTDRGPTNTDLNRLADDAHKGLRAARSAARNERRRPRENGMRIKQPLSLGLCRSFRRPRSRPAIKPKCARSTLEAALIDP